MADPLAGSEVQTPSVGNSLQVVMAGMANVEKEIAEVGKEIMNVEGEIDKSLAALGGGEAYRGITDKEVLQLEKDRLREKEHDLRQEKDRLRQEKDRLREMQLRLIPAPKAPGTKSVVPPEETSNIPSRTTMTTIPLGAKEEDIYSTTDKRS